MRMILPLAGFAAALCAGMVAYVYPQTPLAIWGLLLLCWACYRLHLRAAALEERRKQMVKRAEEVSAAFAPTRAERRAE